MSTIAIFVGAERFDPVDGVEDSHSALRLAALAASWAVTNEHTVLALGDAPALLSIGTAVLGLQQGRVLEGGERRNSPVRILSLLASENAALDRAMSFQRRSREAISEEREPPSAEETVQEEPTFGDLSLLINLGVVDLVGNSFSLEPQAPEEAAWALQARLSDERPIAILAIGEIPGDIMRGAVGYAREMKAPLSCILSDVEGVERLTAAEQPAWLNNRRLVFADGPDFPDGFEDDVYKTRDQELMRVARQATYEAELTLRLYQWLTSIDDRDGGRPRPEFRAR